MLAILSALLNEQTNEKYSQLMLVVREVNVRRLCECAVEWRRHHSMSSFKLRLW